MTTSSRKPIIALTMGINLSDTQRELFHVDHAYAERIHNAGGIPLLVPPIEDDDLIQHYIQLADGFVFIGGKDYHPEFYDATPHPATDLSRLRPRYDIVFAHKAMQTGKPILGICAGCQLIAIACGGKLVQDIPAAEDLHRNKTHVSTITVPGCFADILGMQPGDNVTVNSFHHQAVDPTCPGNGLTITARAFDGTVEAIEKQDAKKMLLGIQFHPERMDSLAPMFFGRLVREATMP